MELNQCSSLHDTPATKMNLFMLIVGMSRVRNSNDFRIMPLHNNNKSDLDYLKELVIPADLKMWMKGINHTTHKFEFSKTADNKAILKSINWKKVHKKKHH